MTDAQPTVEASRSDWRRLGRIAAAHAVMLREAAILDAAAVATLLTAAEAAAGDPPDVAGPSALVAAFEARWDALAPAEASGAGGLGRARADTVAALVRLATRDRLLDLDRALAGTRRRLLDLAADHAFSLMPAFADGRPVQTTTLAHFLGGAIGPLGRAATRLHGAYEGVNRGPLGAVALAASGLPIEREPVAAALGFDGVLDNTFDAVAATDHLAEAAAAAAGAVAPVRRLVAEFLTWLRTEPGSLRVPEEWLAAPDPALPQHRPPAGLVRLVADARSIEVDASGLFALLSDAPYAPSTSTLDAVADPLAALLVAATDVLTRAGELFAALEVNRAHLANRAGRDHTTSAELADYLMLEEGIAPGAARAIAAMAIRRAMEQGIEGSGITPDLIDAAALLVLGRELGIEVEAIGRHLAPRRVLERRTATGSPSPTASRAWLERERELLAADERWRAEAANRLTAAEAALDRAVADGLAAVQ